MPMLWLPPSKTTTERTTYGGARDIDLAPRMEQNMQKILVVVGFLSAALPSFAEPKLPAAVGPGFQLVRPSDDSSHEASVEVAQAPEAKKEEPREQVTVVRPPNAERRTDAVAAAPSPVVASPSSASPPAPTATAEADKEWEPAQNAPDGSFERAFALYLHSVPKDKTVVVDNESVPVRELLTERYASLTDGIDEEEAWKMYEQKRRPWTVSKVDRFLDILNKDDQAIRDEVMAGAKKIREQWEKQMKTAAESGGPLPNYMDGAAPGVLGPMVQQAAYTKRVTAVQRTPRDSRVAYQMRQTTEPVQFISGNTGVAGHGTIHRVSVRACPGCYFVPMRAMGRRAVVIQGQVADSSLQTITTGGSGMLSYAGWSDTNDLLVRIPGTRDGIAEIPRDIGGNVFRYTDPMLFGANGMAMAGVTRPVAPVQIGNNIHVLGVMPGGYVYLPGAHNMKVSLEGYCVRPPASDLDPRAPWQIVGEFTFDYKVRHGQDIDVCRGGGRSI